jgi:hypothetical protein
MKRTKAQEAFDLAKHGWAFQHKEWLAHTIERCAQLLPPNDAKRAETIAAMQRAYSRK